jgi:Fe-S cluster biogenesis protein NfuA
MFVVPEPTPNPRTMRFDPGRAVSAVPGTWRRGDEGMPDVAAAVLATEFVESVFVGADFLSVTVADEVAWEAEGFVGSISLAVAGSLEAPAEMPDGLPAAPDGIAPDPVVARILDVIETRIRPAVASDGGDITFVSFEGGVLTLKMHGACEGCPSSVATLRHGVSSLMAYLVPEVESVRSV